MLIIFALHLLLENGCASVRAPSLPDCLNTCVSWNYSGATLRGLLLVPPPAPGPRLEAQGDTLGEPGVAGGVEGVEEEVGEEQQGHQAHCQAVHWGDNITQRFLDGAT